MIINKEKLFVRSLLDVIGRYGKPSLTTYNLVNFLVAKSGMGSNDAAVFAERMLKEYVETLSNAVCALLPRHRFTSYNIAEIVQKIVASYHGKEIVGADHLDTEARTIALSFSTPS